MAGKRGANTKTRCKRGHLFHKGNTYFKKIGKYTVKYCLTCKNELAKAKYRAERLKEEPGEC